MTFEIYQREFRRKAFKTGFSDEEIQKCLDYAQPIIDKGFPVIYNTSNLAALVGYRKSYLKRAVFFTTYFYRTFLIKKANGKLRTIKEPLPSLKEIQIWILNNILYSLQPSRYAKAYIPKRNILENVRYHRNKGIVLTLDIQNFFPSIKRSDIENIFLRIGYSSNVSNLLSKLCCCDNVLPQGAHTSPYLSNIYLNSFDDVVAKYCKSFNIRFTRYADDMIFSGNFEVEMLIDFVRLELKNIGLILNEEKIKIMHPNNRQIVTGIVVNKVIQIPKQQRLAIKQEIFFIKKYGVSDHLVHTHNNKANYLRHLLGKINYAIAINPSDEKMKAYKQYLKQLLSSE
ncbi:reverse transcriptase family protein [Pedobacter jamesrossensis]|uniref:RNA-directed DNA polymerase n=1 Tax=Pedobacter jamesrossensis TaxID=1908238 RepID=A0ABV8NLG8_9SPHI